MKTIEYIGLFLIIVWGLFGWMYWMVNPELSQMQVFIHMIGLGNE